MIEFVGLSVLLILPVIYLLLTAFQLQRASFGVSQAAREAGRAYSTAPSQAQAEQRARRAAEIAIRDQGVDAEPVLTFSPTPSLQPGARFATEISLQVPLPYAGHGRYLGLIPAVVTVHSSYTVVIDSYRTSR
jgi:hypothetical protein